jgi:hypothetical protein
MKFLCIKTKKNISPLIARDKLPVRTILELHEQEFLMDQQGHNCRGDLKYLGSKRQT